eukprot:TRINITY_DN25621_c0_g1_i2.p1 TRINITY_DN25621_c0_g1~~TRINITY_DN25621_c0_g1_i2.p1  ORF type:complete len:558 (+),score=108.29 TRINITY_DN25621_c0_g1_i2:269-1942(+)
MLTSYLAAVDSRVKAVGIACYFSSLKEELQVGTCNYDAEQILFGQARYGFDKAELLSVRAPRPMSILLTSHDCFPLEGGRQGFMDVARSYAAHGKLDALYASESVGNHEVTETGLEMLRKFFRSELGGEALSPTPENTKPIHCSQLWFGPAQAAGTVEGSKNSRIGDYLISIAAPFKRRLRARRAIALNAMRSHISPLPASSSPRAAPHAGKWLQSLPSVSRGLAAIEPVALEQLKIALGGGDIPTPQMMWQQWFSWGSESWYLLFTQGACAVSLRVYRTNAALRRQEAEPSGVNATRSGRGGAVALLVGGGALLNRKMSIREEHLLGELVARGFSSIVIAGLCGLGDDLWRGGLWEFAPLLLGRTHVGFHASEVIRLVAWTIAVLDASRIVLVAMEGSAAAVMHAVLHIPQWRRPASEDASPSQGAEASQAPNGVLAGVALVRSIASFADIATAKRHRMPWMMQMYGVLAHYDLPDLLAAALKRPGGLRAMVMGGRAASGRVLPPRHLRKLYALASKRHESASGRRLRLLAGLYSPTMEAKVVADFATAAARPHEP